MRRRLLKLLGLLTFRFAWLLLPVLILVTWGAVKYVQAEMHFDTSLVAFLPPPSPYEKNLREAVRDYRNLEPVMIVLRADEPGQEAMLKQMARQYAEEWIDEPLFFTQVVYRMDPLLEQYYESLPDIRLIQLLTPEDWRALEQMLTERIEEELVRLKAERLQAFLPPEAETPLGLDPLGALDGIRERLAASRGPTRLPTRDGYFLSEDGQAIAILAYPTLATENARNADRTYRFLKLAEEKFFERYPDWSDRVTVSYSGGLVETGEWIEYNRDELEILLYFVMGLVVLLLLLAFRKAEAVVYIIVPPLVALAWSLALATWLFGGVTAVTFTFMVVIAAFGLQFSIHLYHRFVFELYRTHDYYPALSRSYVETARGTFATALIMMAIFVLLGLTSMQGVESLAEAGRVLLDTQGLAQLAAVVALAILCNLLAALLLLPALAALKRLLAHNRVRPVPLYRFGLKRLYEPALQRPQATVVALLMVAVILGFYSERLEFHPRFSSVSSFFMQSDGEPDDERAGGYFPRPGRPIMAVVTGDSLEEALAQNDRLYANLQQLQSDYRILSVDSLRTVLPSLQSQEASLEQLRALDLEGIRERVEQVSRRVGLKPELFTQFLGVLEQFKEAAEEPEYLRFSWDELDLINTVARYVTSRRGEGETVGRTYYVRTAIYPTRAGFEPGAIESLRGEVERGLDELILIGDPIVEKALAQTLKFKLALMILLSAVVILPALMLHFRSARLAWLTFVPILVEVLWMCGLMALLGLQLHFFTILALPLVFSLAIDNAIQLTQYYNDRRPITLRRVMLSVGRVIPLTCSVIVLIYGTLALAEYPGFRDLGLTVLIGAVVVVGGTAMLQPALLQLLGEGQSLRSVLSGERPEEENQAEGPAGPSK